MSDLAISPASGLGLFDIFERGSRIRFATVVGLRFHVRPNTISGFVSFLVVHSFNGKFKRFFSHIGEKVSEVMPSFANCNSASAVPFPLSAFWIGASLKHVSPRVIGRRYFAVYGSCVTVNGLGQNFFSVTPATDCMSPRQIVSDGDSFRSTIAAIMPSRVGILRMRKAENDKTTKALIGKVSEGGHEDFPYV